MDRFFNANNPLMKALARIVDVAIINLMTFATSIPIVTAGASLTAMNHVLLHLVRRDETYPWKMYLRSFKANLGQGIRLGLIYLGYAILAIGDLLVLRSFGTRLATGMMLTVTFISGFVIVLGVYTFALQARFENTFRGTIGNAAKLFIGHLPRSMAMLVIWIGWLLVLWLVRSASGMLILLYGVTFPGYLCAMIYDPIFRQMEPPEEDDDDAFPYPERGTHE